MTLKKFFQTPGKYWKCSYCQDNYWKCFIYFRRRGSKGMSDRVIIPRNSEGAYVIKKSVCDWEEGEKATNFRPITKFQFETLWNIYKHDSR